MKTGRSSGKRPKQKTTARIFAKCFPARRRIALHIAIIVAYAGGRIRAFLVACERGGPFGRGVGCPRPRASKFRQEVRWQKPHQEAASGDGRLDVDASRSRFGSCPGSWGVWFPGNPKQTPSERFLDELAEAGYGWLGLGPNGYLARRPAWLGAEVGQRGLEVPGGAAAILQIDWARRLNCEPSD